MKVFSPPLGDTKRGDITNFSADAYVCLTYTGLFYKLTVLLLLLNTFDFFSVFCTTVDSATSPNPSVAILS